MAKKHKHEDHVNHEAWAIPYGDLITLLLAFFVVMYAVSSVNEGKYRVLADSLSQAFGGPPKSMKPVQIGNRPEKGASSDSMFSAVNLRGFEAEQPTRQPPSASHDASRDPNALPPAAGGAAAAQAAETLKRMSDAVEQAMQDLISKEMIVVRRSESWLEIEISTDILYASGVATLSPEATPVLQRLAQILRPFPNPIRIEGHTDNVPISTVAFPSNWELSAARAASVVHLFMGSGIEPQRMTVIGLGQYRPVASNDSVQGRNRNRRVIIVVMAHHEEPALQPDLQPSAPVAAKPQSAVAVPSSAPDSTGGTVVVPAGTLSSLRSSRQ